MKNWLGRTFARAAIETPPDTKSATSSPSGSKPLVALHLSSRAHWTGRDYGALAREGYQKNAVVYRCVRLKLILSAKMKMDVPIMAVRRQINLFCKP